MVFVVGAFVLLILLKINVQTNLGQVGDFVGGLLNPILSFLALIAIAISISIQEKELKSSVHLLQSQEKISGFKILKAQFLICWSCKKIGVLSKF